MRRREVGEDTNHGITDVGVVGQGHALDHVVKESEIAEWLPCLAGADEGGGARPSGRSTVAKRTPEGTDSG